MILAVYVLLFCFVTEGSSRKFPSSFSFGTGSSAYQIEGSWDADGKSENIWDHWIHNNPSHIENNNTADVACEAYNYPLQDVVYLSRLGVHHYQFSIPWTRILPSGFADQINWKAIMHYQNLISLLLYYDIKPIVTLYHHDLPQSLQDIGGWENPEMVKYFVDYARVCFQQFYNVQDWLTFNDPRATCRYGYGDGSYAPGIASDGVGEYLCAYTVLKAHAAVYHLYKEEFKNITGRVSIALDMRWSEPNSTAHAAAVERKNAFDFGLYANPIYKGNWPDLVIERVDYRSKNENFTKSRLPEFTKEEIDYINGTSDFMAVNLFYAHVVEDVEEAEFGDPSYEKDMKAKFYVSRGWDYAENDQPIVPESARKSLVWLSSSFNSPEIFITGNGIPDYLSLKDNTRINYFQDYLSSILDAILEDGVNVTAYTAWSLYDSFEWKDGYSYGFGFYYINPKFPTFRTAKDSLRFYNDLINTLTLPGDDTDTTTTTSCPDTTAETTTSLPDTTTQGSSATEITSYPLFVLIVALLRQLFI